MRSSDEARLEEGTRTTSPPAPAVGRRGAVRVREALRAVVDLSGLTGREIERHLAARGSGLDLSRLLSGKFELKVYQALDVLEVLDIHPVEFFRLVFGAPKGQSPLLVRMANLFAATSAPGQHQPTTRDYHIEELRKLLAEAGRQLDRLQQAQPPANAGQPRSS